MRSACMWLWPDFRKFTRKLMPKRIDMKAYERATHRDLFCPTAWRALNRFFLWYAGWDWSYIIHITGDCID